MAGVIKYRKGGAHGLTAALLFGIIMIAVSFIAWALTSLGLVDGETVLDKLKLSLSVSVVSFFVYCVVVRNLMSQGAKRAEMIGG